MKNYMLLFALAFATAGKVIAMEQAESQLVVLPKKLSEVNLQDFGTMFPREIVKKILSSLPNGTVPEICAHFAKLCLVNKPLYAFIHEFILDNEVVKNQLRERLMAELEEYRKQQLMVFPLLEPQHETALHAAEFHEDVEFLYQYLPILNFMRMHDIINQENSSGDTPMKSLLTHGSANAEPDADSVLADQLKLFIRCHGTFNDGTIVLSLLLAKQFYETAKIMMPLLSCEHIQRWCKYMSNPGDETESFIREHHQCNKCFPS